MIESIIFEDEVNEPFFLFSNGEVEEFFFSLAAVVEGKSLSRDPFLFFFLPPHVDMSECSARHRMAFFFFFLVGGERGTMFGLFFFFFFFLPFPGDCGRVETFPLPRTDWVDDPGKAVFPSFFFLRFGSSLFFFSSLVVT